MSTTNPTTPRSYSLPRVLSFANDQAKVKREAALYLQSIPVIKEAIQNNKDIHIALKQGKIVVRVDKQVVVLSRQEQDGLKAIVAPLKSANNKAKECSRYTRNLTTRIDTIARNRIAPYTKPPAPTEGEKVVNVLTGPTLDTISITRSGLRLSSPTSGITLAVLILSGIIVPLVILIGASLVFNGSKELKEARKIGDREGIHAAIMKILIGGHYASGASVSAAALAHPAVKALPALTTSLYFIGNILSLAMAVYKVYKYHSFRKELNGFFANDKEMKKEELQKALQFLHSQIFITENEKEAIRSEIEEKYPQLAEDKREEFVNQKIDTLLQKKKEMFFRRVGEKAYRELITTVDNTEITVLEKTLTNLQNKNVEEKTLESAKALIHRVKRENTKRTVFYSIITVALFLATLGSMIGLFFAMPHLVIGLGIASSVIYLGVSIYELYRSNYMDKPALVDRTDPHVSMVVRG